MLRFLIELSRCRKAATAVEYGLILSLIFLAMIVGLRELSTESGGLWSRINNKVASAR